MLYINLCLVYYLLWLKMHLKTLQLISMPMSFLLLPVISLQKHLKQYKTFSDIYLSLSFHTKLLISGISFPSNSAVSFFYLEICMPHVSERLQTNLIHVMYMILNSLLILFYVTSINVNILNINQMFCETLPV